MPPVAFATPRADDKDKDKEKKQDDPAGEEAGPPDEDDFPGIHEPERKSEAGFK